MTCSDAPATSVSFSLRIFASAVAIPVASMQPSMTKNRAAPSATLSHVLRKGRTALMGRWPPHGDAVRPKLGRHAPFRAHTPANLDDLSGTQLGEAEAAQALHMNEDVRRAFSARQESETPDPIEPL